MLRLIALLVVIAAVHTEQQLLYPYGYRQISLPLTTTATYIQPATTTSWSYAPLYRPAYSFGTYQYTYPNSYSWQYQKGYQPVYQYAAVTPRYSTVSYSRGARALALAGQTPQQQIQQIQPVQQIQAIPVQSYSHQESQQQQQQQSSSSVASSVALVPVVPVSTGPSGLDQVRIHQQQAIQAQQPYIAGGIVTGPIQSQPIVSQQPQQPQQFVATLVQTQPQAQQQQQQQQQYQTGFQPAPTQGQIVYAPVQSESAPQQQQFAPQSVVISPQFVQPVALPSVSVAYASGTPVVSAGPAPVAPGHHQQSVGHHQVSHVSLPGQVGVGGGYTSSAFYEAAPSAVVIPAQPIGANEVKIGKLDLQQQQQQQQQQSIGGHHQSVSVGSQSGVQSYDVGYQ